MRYVAAYALAVLGGNASPSQKDVEKIIASVGIDAEGDRSKAVVDALKGKTLDEVIAEGLVKLATVPSGGGGGAPAAAAGGSGGGGGAAETKKEEKKKEESEEEDEDMGFGLFD